MDAAAIGEAIFDKEIFGVVKGVRPCGGRACKLGDAAICTNQREVDAFEEGLLSFLCGQFDRTGCKCPDGFEAMICKHILKLALEGALFLRLAEEEGGFVDFGGREGDTANLVDEKIIGFDFFVFKIQHVACKSGVFFFKFDGNFFEKSSKCFVIIFPFHDVGADGDEGRELFEREENIGAAELTASDDFRLCAAIGVGDGGCACLGDDLVFKALSVALEGRNAVGEFVFIGEGVMNEDRHPHLVFGDVEAEAFEVGVIVVKTCIDAADGAEDAAFVFLAGVAMTGADLVVIGVIAQTAAEAAVQACACEDIAIFDIGGAAKTDLA